MIKISPSILSADFSNLEFEVKSLEDAGADMIHIDVMDGHFVPNLTFGASVINSIREHTNLPLDVHLMIASPEKYITDYAEAGADILTIHPETTVHLDKTINTIKKLGMKAGISLLPATSPSVIEYVLDIIDLILVMTVNPGFGGQKFIQSQLAKIKTIHTMIQDRNILLSVDGGIDDQTAKLSVNAGANMLVSGNFIFKSVYKDQINTLRNIGTVF